jgi:hypothetical protein
MRRLVCRKADGSELIVAFEDRGITEPFPVFDEDGIRLDAYTSVFRPDGMEETYIQTPRLPEATVTERRMAADMAFLKSLGIERFAFQDEIGKHPHVDPWMSV